MPCQDYRFRVLKVLLIVLIFFVNGERQILVRVRNCLRHSFENCDVCRFVDLSFYNTNCASLPLERNSIFYGQKIFIPKSLRNEVLNYYMLPILGWLE